MLLGEERLEGGSVEARGGGLKARNSRLRECSSSTVELSVTDGPDGRECEGGLVERKA